ncbi:MAG: hypothetical protein JST04_07525 [Bdellovibrionales bacterium]|nr:hypothetical protein [Bdellovibrionales bacterium]
MKHTLKSMLLIVAITTLTLGCGGKKVKYDAKDNTIAKDNVASLTIISLKDKGKKADIWITVSNLSDQFEEIPWSDFVCKRNGISGTSKVLNSGMGFDFNQVKNQLGNTFGNNFKLSPKEIRKVGFQCVFDNDDKGQFEFMIRTVYQNKNKDGDGNDLVKVADTMNWKNTVTE